MAVENLKSTSITNDDVPSTNSTGKGAPGRVNIVDDYVTLSASASVTSTYRVVRVPTTAKVKRVTIESEAQGAGKVNVSVYYSDGYATDGSPASQAGAIVASTGDSFFASDVDLASAVTPTDITNESGNYTLDKRGKALWDALGLTSDPGGFFDLVLVVHTTAVTTGTGKTGLRCEYVN